MDKQGNMRNKEEEAVWARKIKMMKGMARLMWLMCRGRYKNGEEGSKS